MEQYQTRYTHGMNIEKEFSDYISSGTLWRGLRYGQDNCPLETRKSLRTIQIPIDSDYAKQKINRLPANWQKTYVENIGNYFPSLARWDADMLCEYNGKACFFAELKSTNVKYSTTCIEISSYLAALTNERLGAPLYFIFNLPDKEIKWSYLSLDELPRCVVGICDGKSAAGSKTPFVKIDKRYLGRPIEHLLAQFQDDWLL